MRSHAENLLEKIRRGRVKVAIIGLGYVGLPLALRFTSVGIKVFGIDIDGVRVRELQAGRSYLNYVSSSAIRAAIELGFETTTDLAVTNVADVAIMCLPTPLTNQREPDISFVVEVVSGLCQHARVGQLFALESTTYPGTTEDVVRPLLERTGFSIGDEIFLVYSPERIDPGNPSYEIANIPKLVSGSTPTCLTLGSALYALVAKRVVSVSSTRAAELAKLFENVQRAVNIGLVNELKMLADQIGIDIFEVVEAAATKPFGFVPYLPGPGLGGHCIPVDPFYLSWKAKQYGLNMRLADAAGEVNRGMPEWVFHKTVEALNTRGQRIEGSRILVLGVAYKKNVGDIRESPGLALIDLFQAHGATVDYSDPYVPVIDSVGSSNAKRGVEVTVAQLTSANAVVLATDHDEFDYAAIAQHACLLIDTRGRYRNLETNTVRA
jgi:UDP-N-acetyl-D-glucosamine dehydrogenase